MRTIVKRTEPPSLLAYRQTPLASYDGLPADVKRDMRTALLEEQGFICCYCMCRLHDDPDLTKIEHLVARAVDPALELTWSNLFACCKGGEGTADEHCDRTKKDLRLSQALTNHQLERAIGYLANGRIMSSDGALNTDVSVTLNLNTKALMRARAGFLSGMVQGMEQSRGGQWTARYVERRLQELVEGSGGSLVPFCQVGVHWLVRRLRRQ